MSKLMKIDSLTTAALADEFRLKIMGGRVQKIVQVTAFSFGFEIYCQSERQYLCLSADPQTPGAYLQSLKTRRGIGNETPLQQLFQKYLKNGFLMTIEQPALERVLLFHFSGKAGKTTLVLEMLGTRTNLIFLDELDQILALARPSVPQTEGRRPLLAGHLYHLPEPQQKLTAKTLTVEVLIDVADRAPQDNLLSRTLVTRLAGLSPLIAREIVYRAYGDADLRVGQVTEFELLLKAIRQVYGQIDRHEWQPHVAFDKNAVVEYFAPIALTHLPQTEPVESMSMAVEAHFSAAEAGEIDAYQAVRFPIQLAIEQALTRLERRQKKLDQDQAALEDPEIFRQKGEAILSYSYQVKPRQTSLEVIWTEGETLIIELDPAISASQNAQRYFDRYQKAKRAAEIIPKQRKRIALQREYLNQLSLDLEIAETRPEIDAVAASLQSAGFDKDFRKKSDKKPAKKAIPAASQPRRFVSPDGFAVWVGRNAEQNHDLTFGRARPDDIWLHARGVPGSHVVISVLDDAPPPKTTIEWAAGIAAYYSKAKGAGRAIVSYTRKKYVRPIKGAPPGLVRIHNESTIRVAPFKPDGA